MHRFLVSRPRPNSPCLGARRDAGQSPEAQVSGGQRSQAQSQQALLHEGLRRQGGGLQTLHAAGSSVVRQPRQRVHTTEAAGPACSRRQHGEAATPESAQQRARRAPAATKVWAQSGIPKTQNPCMRCKSMLTADDVSSLGSKPAIYCHYKHVQCMAEAVTRQLVSLLRCAFLQVLDAWQQLVSKHQEARHPLQSCMSLAAAAEGDPSG